MGGVVLVKSTIGLHIKGVCMGGVCLQYVRSAESLCCIGAQAVANHRASLEVNPVPLIPSVDSACCTANQERGRK